LVLTHTPSAAARLPPRGCVCLAGHTHGGHFVVPGLTDRVLEAAKEPWIRGWYEVGGNRLYVNRGLGAGGPGHFPRVASPPEVSLFTLRRGGAAKG
jgi:predicted MPP superfamily phosphohydrolase